MKSRQCKLYCSKVEMGGKQHSWTYFPLPAIRLAQSKRPMNEKHEGFGRHTRIYCPATGNPSSGDWGRESEKKRSEWEWEFLCHEKCFKCWNKTNETYLVYLSLLQVSLLDRNFSASLAPRLLHCVQKIVPLCVLIISLWVYWSGTKSPVESKRALHWLFTYLDH